MLIKNLLALTLCVVARADIIQQTLDDIVELARTERDIALNWKRVHGGARNDLASVAAGDFYKRAVKKTEIDRSELSEALLADYEHHKYWEDRFRRWGGHRNNYAQHIHGLARDSFQSAYDLVEELQSVATTLAPTTAAETTATTTTTVAPTTEAKTTTTLATTSPTNQDDEEDETPSEEEIPTEEEIPSDEETPNLVSCDDCSDANSCFLRNQENPSQFFICAHGEPVKMECPPGLVWDVAVTTCNRP